jgi:hypothetical protein
MNYKVKVIYGKPFVVDVTADSEDEAFSKVDDLLIDVEPIMEIVK